LRTLTHSPSTSVWPGGHSWIIGTTVVGVGEGVGEGVATGVQVPRASAFSPAGQQAPIAVAWPAGQQAPLAIGIEPRTQHCPPEAVDPVGIAEGRHWLLAGPPATCPTGQQTPLDVRWLARQHAPLPLGP
jgi:hypothetical protein